MLRGDLMVVGTLQQFVRLSLGLEPKLQFHYNKWSGWWHFYNLSYIWLASAWISDRE